MAFPYKNEYLESIEKLLEQKIVRFEIAEKKLNVEFRNISVVCGQGRGEQFITIYYGIYSKSGIPLDKEINVKCVFYGRNNRIIHMQRDFIVNSLKDSFFDIRSICISSSNIFERNISKILLFPTE